MTSNDGASSSGRIIEDQYITAPISAGGDGITVYGSDGPVVIRRCVVDLGSWPLERLDEGLSGVDGARAVVRETRVARVGKGVLWAMAITRRRTQARSWCWRTALCATSAAALRRRRMACVC